MKTANPTLLQLIQSFFQHLQEVRGASPHTIRAYRDTFCKRRLKSAAGGARKVRHLPGQRELVSLVFVKPRGFVAR